MAPRPLRFARLAAFAALMLTYPIAAAVAGSPRVPAHDDVVPVRGHRVAPPAPTAARSAGALPTATLGSRRAETMAGSFVTANDSFLVASFGFQNPDSSCQTRGWTGTDLTGQVFAHVTSSYVVNQSLLGGLQATAGITYPAPLDSTPLDLPRSLAIDAAGRLVFFQYDSNSGTNRLFRVDPTLDFAAKTDFATGNFPYSVAIGDVSGDGEPDLAVANLNSDAVSVLLGNGAGGFGAKTDFATGAGPRSVAIGDLNGDGGPDLAVANFVSYTVSVLLGNGAGGFGAKTDFATGTTPHSVAIGDVNGDGKPDLAVANYQPSTVSVLLGNGAGGFAAKTDFATGTGPLSLAIGDVNGDGRPDLAVANRDANTVSVLLGDGAGGFGPKTDFATGSTPPSVAIRDVNGDGKPDLAVANYGSSTVSVLLGNGAGGFGAKTDFATGSGPSSVALGDVNGDGRPDLAVANSDSNTVSVLLNTTGMGLFRPAPTSAPDAEFVPARSGAVRDPLTGGILTYDIGGTNSGRIFLFPDSGSAVLLAGNNSGSGSPNDTLALSAQLGTGSGIAVDGAGNVYFPETATHRVRMLRRNDGRIVTIAGNGTEGYSGDGGQALAAQLTWPFAVGLDTANGLLYIVDQYNTVVRRVDLPTGIITTLIPADPAGAFIPTAIAVSGSTLYITGSNFVYRYSGGVLTPIAGGGRYATPSVPLRGLEQDLMDPRAPLPDGAGGLYFLEPNLRLIFHLLANGDLVRVAGVPIPLDMGARALRVGSDMNTAPAVVGSWLQPSGYGNGWSQRLTSPTISSASVANAVLGFDAMVDLESQQTSFDFLDDATEPEFVGVQALRADGTWGFLVARTFERAYGFAVTRNIPFEGTALGRFEVHLGADGNESFPYAASTRLRIVVQTSVATSNEDGLVRPGIAAAILDNLTLKNGASDLLPPVDFEDGGTGGWSLSALNGAFTGNFPYTRDVPAPATQVALRSAFDFNDPSCAWTFASAGDSLPSGVYANLTSPWIATAAPDSGLLIAFSGKLNTIDQKRYLDVRVLGKNAGDDRPRAAARLSAVLNSGTSGGDLASPFVDQRVLRYPQDFAGGTPGYDSLQVVFLVEDRGDELIVAAPPSGATGATVVDRGRPGASALGALDGRPRTRLPYLDDIRFYQIGVDSDFDGVANNADACPTTCAAGQDADGDGCVDPHATLRHVESWNASSLPLHYRISQNGIPRITDGSDKIAIQFGFSTWTTVPGAALGVVRDTDTAQQDASALDGINLVTAEDPDFPLPPNVLGVTLTTSLTRRGAFGDRIALPGEIFDADMILNPLVSFATPGNAGTFDLASVITHEAGHFYGLSHSGVLKSTMFFVLQSSFLAASLENDDRAAIAAAYPGPLLDTNFGAIKGSVTRGGTGAPLPGALVTAVQLGGGGAPVDSVSSDYTAEDGSYALYRLPAGNYAVRITPLDGAVGGYPLTPKYISTRVLAIAQTNFPAEWWSTPESDRDDPNLRATIPVTVGSIATGFNVVTNVDTIPPTVVRAAPPADSSGIRIDTAVLVEFSEPVNQDSLGSAFRFRINGQTGSLLGKALLLAGSRTFLFIPTDPLVPGTEYEIAVTTRLTDRDGLHLAQPFSSTFTTQAPQALAITNVLPRSAPSGGYITILGAGFDPAPGATSVEFAGADPVSPVSVTPTSLVVRVPGAAVTGDLRVLVVESPSTPFGFTVLNLQSQAAPAANGAPIPLGFQPSDVALAPDGLTAYAVGAGGLATISLAPGPGFRTPVARGLPNARRVALTLDGLRAFVTRPSLGQLVEVNADPGSPDLGQPLGFVSIPGSPDAVALSLSGRRAYVTDQARPVVYVVDTDPASVTYRTVRDTIPVSGGTPTGGLAVNPADESLYLTTSAQGVLIEPDGSVVAYAPEPTSGGAAVTPFGDEALFATNGVNLRFLVQGEGFYSGDIALGGAVRDVVVSPGGRSALAVNSGLGLVQVVNLEGGDPGYHTQVSEVATGSNPRALDVSGDGTALAVANFGDGSISLYTLGAAATLTRVAPAFASPGDLVTVQQTGSDIFTAGTQIDLGGTLVPATLTNGFSAAFRMPASMQKATSAAMQFGSERTLSLPFTVVDPIASFAVKSMNRSVGPPIGSGPCAPDTVAGAFRELRRSPDGRVVAALRGVSNCENDVVDLWEASATGAAEFGKYLGRISGFGIDEIRAIGFTPDSRRLWLGVGPTLYEGSSPIYDVEPGSPTFAEQDGWVSLLGDPSAILPDPLGRYMFVGYGGGEVRRFPLDEGSPVVLETGAQVFSLAASPDGHYLVVGRAGHVSFRDLVTGTTPVTGPTYPISFRHVAVSGNGGFAAGIGTGSQIGIWNLDPAAGPVGTQRYFGTPGARPAQPDAIVPAPDGSSFVVGAADCDSLTRVNPTTVTPVLSYSPIGRRSHALARSPDGRVLWVARNHPSELDSDVRLFTLSEATAMSLVSGGGQSALANQPLAQPVRVRLTGPDGRPQQGVVVRFQLPGLAAGYLDGDPGRFDLRRFTDANGEAQVSWTMPSGFGAQALTIGAEGIAGQTIALAAQSLESDATAAPSLIATGPASGATGVNSGTPVFAQFSQKMDSVSTIDHFTLSAGGSPVAGRFRFEDQGRFVVFQPAQPLPYGANCLLSITAGALDREGQMLAAPTTVGFAVQLPPPVTISSLSPPAAPRGASVVITGTGFSAAPSQNAVSVNGAPAPVVAATLTTLAFAVPDAATSGPVTVQVGGTTSSPLPFQVLAPAPSPGGPIDSLTASPGIRDVAITPDQQRAYVTNPATNSVTAIDIASLATLASITVGLQPQSIAILPDGSRAFVANSGSNDVSVINTDPGAGPAYNTVVKTIPVGPMPLAVEVSAFDGRVIVVNAGSPGTLSLIDAQPANGTADFVVTTVNIGSGGTDVAISPDGTSAYVATPAGVVVVDLGSNSVVTTVNIGSGGTDVAISPDGTIVLALSGNDSLYVINVTPGFDQYQVVTTVNIGSGGTDVAISPDGGLAYVTAGDGDNVQVFAIGKANQSGSSSFVPGPAVTLTLVSTVSVGRSPVAVKVVVDDMGRPLAFVANQGSGSVSIIGFGEQVAAIPIQFEFKPNSIKYKEKQMEKLVFGYLVPQPPFFAGQIVVSSIRINGIVPPDTTTHGAQIQIRGPDHLPQLKVYFSRNAVALTLPEGDDVPVVVTGTMAGQPFRGVDSVKVKRPKVKQPKKDDLLPGGQPSLLTWEVPADDSSQYVAILHSVDRGANWILDASELPNTGSYWWTVPDIAADSVKIAVVQVQGIDALETTNPDDPVVIAVLAVSDYFGILATTDVDGAPVSLAFAPISPNPAAGQAHFRFGLPARAQVSLAVYDVLGRRVASVVDAERGPGWHNATWNGRNERGGRVGAGVYFVRFSAAGRTFNHRLVWLR